MCFARTGTERAAHVGRLHVLLVGVTEARPGVELLAVQPELVLVRGCRVHDGVFDVACGKVEDSCAGRCTARVRCRPGRAGASAPIQSLRRESRDERGGLQMRGPRPRERRGSRP